MKRFFSALGGLDPDVDAGESVVHEGAANLWRGLESVGGWLWLTNRRLVFRSHRLALRAGETVWTLAEITGAAPARSMWIVPNGLRVTLEGGRDAAFVVRGRMAWVRAIEAALAAESR